ncbi:MAG: hypothetical protein J5720_06130 [Bacteroidaceae bacterium]|nr:hypothetical protein [Bacteroidaceae bacterium]
MGIIVQGVKLGISRFLTIFCSVVLWLLTIWIPYLNVGTTIAICTMPIALADNDKLAKPTYIFAEKYRKYMGDFFTLLGLLYLTLIPAYIFGVIPAIIIGIGWSMAFYILFDKHITPSDALLESTEKTYGHKMTIFLAFLLYNVGFAVIWGIIYGIVTLIGVLVGSIVGTDSNAATAVGLLIGITIVILAILFFAVYQVGIIGCQAVIYRKLCKEKK